MSYKIFCILRGGRSAFPVNIKQTETVDDLKDAIKAKKKRELDALSANALSLYQVNIDASNMRKAIEVAEAMFQGLETSENMEELNPVDELQAVFQDHPAGRRVHILVRRPGGKLIDLWICGAVAETMTDYPSNNSYCHTDEQDDGPHPDPMTVDEVFFWPQVTFKLESSGHWKNADLFKNEIQRAEIKPEYINQLKDKLSRKRLVTNVDIRVFAVGALGFCVPL